MWPRLFALGVALNLLILPGFILFNWVLYVWTGRAPMDTWPDSRVGAACALACLAGYGGGWILWRLWRR